MGAGMLTISSSSSPSWMWAAISPIRSVLSSRELAKDGYGVIYITEELFEGLSEEVEYYRDKPLPAIIPIPGVKGNTGIGMRNVSLSVEKAVGSDIIS